MGKRDWDALEGQYASQVRKSPTDIIVVATTKIQTALIMDSVGHLNLEVMLDSGASISLLAQASVVKITNTIEKPIPKVLLKTASGLQLPIVNYVSFCSHTKCDWILENRPRCHIFHCLYFSLFNTL